MYTYRGQIAPPVQKRPKGLAAKVRFLARKMGYFSLLRSAQTVSGVHSSFYCIDLRDFLLVGKGGG
jgi:hypothetical protein